MFHPDELKGVKAGEIVCMGCTLDQGYYLFLGEVMDGQHAELIAELQQKLIDEADD